MPHPREMASIKDTILSVWDNIPREQTIFQDQMPAMGPLFKSAADVYAGTIGILAEKGIKEENIIAYNKGLLTFSPKDAQSSRGELFIKYARQYEHIRKVVGATLELKRYLIDKKAPTRAVAYQGGTGWPLPEEIEGVCEKVGFIHYGEGALAEFFPAGSEKNPNAGMHVYKVKGKNGHELTLLALEKRVHAYTETDSVYPQSNISFMPQVLKGIGVEVVLSGYASGIDTKFKGTTEKFKPRDMGVAITGVDLAGYSAHYGPTSGNTEITGPVLGNSKFLPLVDMLPDKEDVKLLLDAFDESREKLSVSEEIKPDIHPVMQADTDEEHFESSPSQIRPWTILSGVADNGFLNKELLKLFPDQTTGLVHGMVQLCERIANFMSDINGVKNPWNRRIRDVSVEYFSDKVNPDDSKSTSNDQVEEAVKAGAPFVSNVITTFFRRYAEKNPS